MFILTEVDGGLACRFSAESWNVEGDFCDPFHAVGSHHLLDCGSRRKFMAC